MPQQLEETFLHIRSRETNLLTPYSKYVSSTTFPEQDKEKLDTYITLRFRNMYHPDPILDEGEVWNPDEEGIAAFGIFSANCRIVRFDLGEPYRIIGISDDYQYILVGDSRKYEDQILQYPIQFNEFTTIKVQDQYPAQPNWIDGITLRVDNGEPCQAVLMEYIDEENNIVRFVTGDECFSSLQDYYRDPYDYDGEDSVDHTEEYGGVFDMDGGRTTELDDVLVQFNNINGGTARTLHDTYNTEFTNEEIVEMREEILEGVIIYGTE